MVFNLPATDQNFYRMGSALVALRKETLGADQSRDDFRCSRAQVLTKQALDMRGLSSRNS